MLGVALFFEKNLLRFGNLMFLSGVPLIIGPGRTAGFFLQPKKARATSCLGLGVALVFLGRPMLGMALEAFGFLNLFGNLFPIVFMMAKRVPVVGDLLGGGGGGGGKRKRRRDEESYMSEGDYGGEYGEYGSEYGGGDGGDGYGDGYGGDDYGTY